MLGRATRSVQLFSQGSLHPPATFPHCRSGQCTGLRGFHRSRSVMSAHIYSYTHRASDASSSSSHPVQPTPSGSDKTPSTVQVASHNQYKTPRLLPEHLNPDPLVQFKEWFTAALDPSDGQPQVKEPEAMTVGTVSKEGIPSSRVVLLKTVDERGFVFFTNYNSRKSSELAGQGGSDSVTNPNLSLSSSFVLRPSPFTDRPSSHWQLDGIARFIADPGDSLRIAQLLLARDLSTGPSHRSSRKSDEGRIDRIFLISTERKSDGRLGQ